MNRLLELQQQKQIHITAAQALLKLAETEKRVPTKDERAQIASETALAEGINETLVLEQRVAAAGNIPNDRSTGAQVHDNFLGKPFGPEPRANETAKQRKARLSLGLGEQLQAIVRSERSKGRDHDPRLDEINRRSVGASGASEAVPADGGFLIYPDFSDQIMEISHDVGLVHTRARQLPLSDATNAIKVPGIDEQSRADGSRWGGVRMYWMNEADALTGSKPKFRLIELVTKKLGGLYYATDELIADARVLGQVVTQAFGEELGFKMDDAVINGDGSGKPLGIMNANCLITVPKTAGQATLTLTFQNIVNMFYRLHARSRKYAVWFVNQDVEQQLMQLAFTITSNTGGQSLVEGLAPLGVQFYVPPGVNGNQWGMMFGIPVIPIEQCQSLTTTGDIILADLTQYVLVDKGDVQQATSMHVRFLTDELTFRWIYRTDGQPIWHTALTPFNGTNTQSPFIALASR